MKKEFKTKNGVKMKLEVHRLSIKETIWTTIAWAIIVGVIWYFFWR
ncbi:hypothetical protein [Fructobacillus cardui]|nr:hypothetical protein [Fructobacillus cardui]MCK8627199.1 hypothetical protein [Fructobacillus cardui]